MIMEKVSKSQRLIPSTRFTSALLVSFALFSQYAQRISLPMGIVCMVNRTNVHSVTNITSQLSQINKNSMSTPTKHGLDLFQDKRFFFSEFEQQILLGAHWFGYLFTLGPGGWISIKLGAKRTFAFGILLSSMATLAMVTIYYVNDMHFSLAVIFRVIAGLGHGPLFPATYTFWSMWAVPLERSTLTSIGFCSTNLGTSLTMLFSGVLCRYVNSGWIYIFFLTSMFGFIWLPFWLWLVTDSPLSHRTISERERNYISERIGISANDKKARSSSYTSVPWRKVLRSKPVIGLVLTQVLNLFGLFFFYTNIGKLLTEIHHLSAQHAGYVLAVGFLLMPIVSLLTGIFADYLARSKSMTLTNVRKLFTSLASFLSAGCMFILCFCDHTRQILGIIVVFIFLISSALAYGSGYIVNFGDVVPAYSSIIFAVGSSIGTIGALLGNLVAGILIKRPILEDWRKILLLFAIMYTLGGIIYLVYGSAVPRKWATFNSKQTEEQKENEALTVVPSQTCISDDMKETEIH